MEYFGEKSTQVKPSVLKAFGIQITSRYGKAIEIIEMISFCEKIAENSITSIKEVFYDSKASICNFVFEFSTFLPEEKNKILQIAKETIGQFMWIDECIYHKHDIDG